MLKEMPIPSNEMNDPTRNVLLTIQAAVNRLEGLREADLKRLEEKINEESKRSVERFKAEAGRVDELLRLRAESSLQLSIAETKRLDSVRSVDVGAVSVAAERSAQQAVVLASQVTASAETLRTLVASTATTVAQQLAQLSAQLSDRISALEKSSYEGVGKGRVTDPIQSEMLQELKSLRDQNSRSSGFAGGIEKFYGWLVAAAAVGFAIYKSTGK